MEYKIITIIITYFIWVYYVKKKKIAKLLPARLLCVVSVAVRKARGSRPLSGLHNRANVTAYIRQSYNRHNYYLGFKNNSCLC